MYPDKFKWKEPPYEYEYDRNPFDVIAGTLKLREAFENGVDLMEIAASWDADEESFAKTRQQHLLY
jgi:uncharacterized protein YbbC (DUF1343 family)